MRSPPSSGLLLLQLLGQHHYEMIDKLGDLISLRFQLGDLSSLRFQLGDLIWLRFQLSRSAAPLAQEPL